MSSAVFASKLAPTGDISISLQGTGPSDVELDHANARLLERAGHGPGALEVYEDDSYRWLQNHNGTLQSVMELRAPERLVLPYTAAMTAALLFTDSPRTALLLGLGGGSQARFLAHHFHALQITAWESDARASALARRYFALPGQSLRVLEEDARTGVAGTDGEADLILLDVFTADGLPPWVCEPTLAEACRRALGARGVLAANLWVSAEDESLSVMHGLQRAFDHRVLVLALAGYRNLVVLAFERAPPLDFAGLEARARRLGKTTGIDYLQLLAGMRESNASNATGFIF